MSSLPRTRHKSDSKYGGAPSELPTAHLPSNGEIASYFYLLSSRSAKTDDIICILVTDIQAKWANVNRDLPLKDDLKIRTKTRRLIENIKAYNSRKKMKKAQREDFESKKDLLFDIAACSCELPLLPCSSR